MLAGFGWKLMWETVLRCLRDPRTPPDGVSVRFSAEAPRESDSIDGPIRCEPWLLSSQYMEEMAFEKALGDF